eukprot:GHVU01055040.1.p1 GENE.GHVU01055040.1~~GHVU01055040.1.p1  ORF type:complete len:150 (-),score=35.24 GHVU01055040.1:333-716(-)
MAMGAARELQQRRDTQLAKTWQTAVREAIMALAASSVGNDKNLVTVVQRVAARTHSPNIFVRLEGLLLLEHLWTRLRTALVPAYTETIQALADLVDDSVPAVEAAANRLVALLEALTGENLQSHLRM